MTYFSQQHSNWFLVMGFGLLIVFNGCSGEAFKAKLDGSEAFESNTPSEDRPLTPAPDPSNPAVPADPIDLQSKAAFVAVGHMASSFYSCDGGETWQGYKSADDTLRCWDPNAAMSEDCDFNSYSARGLTWGPSGFVATFGWGAPGSVRKTIDGENWEIVDEGNTWAGVTYGDGRYILNKNNPLYSTDGKNWEAGGEIKYNVNPVQIEYVPQGLGVFIGLGSSGSNKNIFTSTNSGQSFSESSNLPLGCGDGMLASGRNRILLFSDQLCYSDDQGDNWRIITEKPDISSFIYDGKEFKAYGNGQVYHSRNGESWMAESLQINGMAASADLNFTKVSYHGQSKKYVAIAQGIQNWYENTRFFHSTDGVSWIELDKSMGEAPASPHPVRYISAGYLKECAN